MGKSAVLYGRSGTETELKPLPERFRPGLVYCAQIRVHFLCPPLATDCNPQSDAGSGRGARAVRECLEKQGRSALAGRRYYVLAVPGRARVWVSVSMTKYTEVSRLQPFQGAITKQWWRLSL